MLTATAAGYKCYAAHAPFFGTSMTITMSAWTYTGWKAHLFTGPTAATSVWMATLTTTNPSVFLAVAPFAPYWIQIVSDVAGSVTVHQT